MSSPGGCSACGALSRRGQVESQAFPVAAVTLGALVEGGRLHV